MTRTAEKMEMASTMARSAVACSRPLLAYASLISLSPLSRPGPGGAGLRNGGPGRPVRCAVSFGARVLAEGADSLEDLLVHDEDEPENEEREYRRDGEVHQPVPPFALASGDPALHRRQPESEQEEAAHRIL